MTDEQIIRYYQKRERDLERAKERYWSDPDYREHRRRQNAEHCRRYRARLRQMRQG